MVQNTSTSSRKHSQINMLAPEGIAMAFGKRLRCSFWEKATNLIALYVSDVNTFWRNLCIWYVYIYLVDRQYLNMSIQASETCGKFALACTHATTTFYRIIILSNREISPSKGSKCHVPCTLVSMECLFNSINTFKATLHDY